MDLTSPPLPAGHAAPEKAARAGVILIDSDPVVRRDLQAMLEANGARLLAVSSAAEAVELADRGEAAVVLCAMSAGDGPLRALAERRMDSRPACPWTLVALVPASAGEADIERLHRLADDFLQLPLSAGWLGARLRMYLRMGAYVERTQAQRTMLMRHQDEAEEEQRIASYLISRLEGLDPLAERLMHAWVSPAHHLSGDVVAVARSPDDRINVLLADGTGHGLAAAISVLPVSEVFRRMTDRGFDIASIVTEMNRKLRSCMPADRFVACAAASIDMRDRVVELWNGGCPPVMLLGSDGCMEHIWRSRHMALGILDDKDFDSTIERFSYREQSQLMVVSDGLSEALGQDGKHRFGDRELLEAVRGEAPSRLSRVISRLQASACRACRRSACRRCRNARGTRQRAHVALGTGDAAGSDAIAQAYAGTVRQQRGRAARNSPQPALERVLRAVGIARQRARLRRARPGPSRTRHARRP